MFIAFFWEAFVHQTSNNDSDIAFGAEISIFCNYIPDDNEQKFYILHVESYSFNIL